MSKSAKKLTAIALKAVATRRANAAKRSATAKKAWASRRKNSA